MKIIYIGAFIVLSCNNSKQAKLSEIKSPPDTSGPITLEQTSDSSKWNTHFLELKKAVEAGDKNATKSFINFPIKNKGNEIWYLADSRLVSEIPPDETRPFTEDDFDKYYSSLFSLDLRKTIGKLNVEEFFKTNKTASPEIEVVQGSRSKLEATFDNSRHTIILALVTKLTEQGNSKFTIYYRFDVLNDGDIKFKEVHVE